MMSFSDSLFLSNTIKPLNREDEEGGQGSFPVLGQFLVTCVTRAESLAMMNLGEVLQEAEGFNSR